MSVSRKCVPSPASDVPCPTQLANAEKIIKSFNTWAFKREQPSDHQQLVAAALAAAELGEPLRFVLYWGKGPRHTPGHPEAQCLQYLASMTARIAAVHTPGAQMTLIATDTHAKLNGHSASNIDIYFDHITDMAAAVGFDVCRLSAIMAATQTTPSPETATSHLLTALTGSAAKWYAGTGSPSEAAMRYFAMNMHEKCAVAAHFPHSIFVTFNSSDVNQLFPATMPIFYMYSIRRGVAVKPWFMPDTAPMPVGHSQAMSSGASR